jgi:hypothetical protein
MSLRLVESALQRTPRVTVNGNPIYLTSAILISGFDLSIGGYVLGMAITESREVTIEATPEQIMEVLMDLQSLTEWSSAHQEVEVLERDDQGRPRKSRQVVKIVGISDEQVLDYTVHGDGVSWTLVSSKQQRAQDGRYTLTPDGDATRVRFDLTIDPTVPLPGFLIRKGANGLMDTATKGLRKRVLNLKGG